MPRCICNALCHTACQFPVTYVMHAIWTIFHVSWTIISKTYNFQTIHINVNILEFIYQHSLNNYHQVSQSKASKDNLVFVTNCDIREPTKQSTHTAITGHTSDPTRLQDSPEPQSRILVPKLVQKIRTQQINNPIVAVLGNGP